MFFRYTDIAFKSGLLERFWELPVEDKAWVMAYLEAKELLEAIIDFNRSKELP